MNSITQQPISRKRWLQLSALLAGSMSLMYNPLKARAGRQPLFKKIQQLEEQLILEAPPSLKARLFANENPWGPCPKAKEAVIAAVDRGNYYPMREAFALMERIAEMEGITPEQLLPSPGSSTLLASLGTYFGSQGGNMVSSELSYEHLLESAEAMGVEVKRVPLGKNYMLDLKAMEAAIDTDTKAVYICNPNNPTGTHIAPEDLRDFCHRNAEKTTIIVDEAYLHYLEDDKRHSMADCVQKGQNVLVLRTFSKLYGFAGLRFGYVMGAKEVLDKIFAFSAPAHGLPITSIAAANAALDEHAFHQEVLQNTRASKEFLYKTLTNEGYTYIPSSTNFVLFPIQMEGKRFTDEMMKRGVGVRYWDFQDKSYCRVSIGRLEEMKAFADAFREIS